jgi:hypothetical protein
MIRRRLALVAVAALAACVRAPEPPRPPDVPAARAPTGVFLISVAGLTPLEYRGRGAETPPMTGLAARAAAGVAAEGVTPAAPATTYPAHATLITGHRPAGHGIVADRRLGDRGVRALPYWHASLLQTPPLWQLAAERGLRVAALGWPSTVGAAIAQLVSDRAPSRRGETWLEVLEDSATPALIQIARESGAGDPEAERSGPRRDAVLVDIACALLASEQPPQLLLLHLSQAVPVLTSRGPGSAEARQAFARIDAEIERVARCGDPAGRDAAVVVVGDHGTAPLHTLLAPNAALAREGLIRQRTGLIEEWSAIARSNGGSAFVYARNAEAALHAREVLSAEAESTRAFRLVSAQEMLALGADPDAWFGLEAELGFGFTDVPLPPSLRPAASRAVAGYLPDRPEMSTGFVAWGRGLRQGVRVPSMRQTDVAPTVAALLGLDFGKIDGRPLVGALGLPAVAAGAGVGP